MQDNKQKAVYTEFAAFCPTNCMQYPLNSRNWFMQQLRYTHRVPTACGTPSKNQANYESEYNDSSGGKGMAWWMPSRHPSGVGNKCQLCRPCSDKTGPNQPYHTTTTSSSSLKVA